MNYPIQPPADLLNKILKRIHNEERFLLYRRIILFSGILFSSMLGFLPVARILMSDFERSGFIQFSALIFYDFSIVAAHWQSFAMLILQTLPAISLALFLTVLLAFLQSVKSLARDLRIIIKPKIA